MTAQTILPANSVTGGFEVDHSVRFDRASDSLLYADNFANHTSTKKFTISFWVKRSILGSNQAIISQRHNNSYSAAVKFKTDNTLEVFDVRNDEDALQVVTNRTFTDTSAWYHIVVSSDVSPSSPALKIFVNGVQETSFATSNQYSQNETTSWNNGYRMEIGSVNGDYFDGYIAQPALIDAYDYDADSFGEFDEDTGIWKPIDVSGLTFGTNGFYLDFESSGNMGNDATGGTDFTESNIAAVDQATDTCTNNFSTLNPLASITDVPTFSDGNLTIDISDAGRFGAQSTIGVSQGKWYAEFKLVASSDNDMAVGVNSDDDSPRGDLGAGFGTHSTSYRETGNLAVNGTDDISYGNSYTVNDIIGIALDLDNNKLYFSKNGTFQASGDPTSGATGTGAKALTASASTTSGFYFFNPSCHSSSQNGDWSANFGSPPYAISSSNADGSGFGNFEYAPPSGYFALCTKNLAEHG